MKFYVAFSMNPNETDLLGKVSLALVDWGEIPTHWLKRTCSQARRTCEYMPKPAQVIKAYRELWTDRRRRVTAVKQARERRAILPEPKWSEEQREAIFREAYRNMGVDYNLLKRKRAFEEETRSQRMERKKGV